MRVKLSYTAAVEEVLPEAANLLANFGGKLSTGIELFNRAVENLRAEEFNSAQLHSELDLLRRQLAELDIRLMEVIQIVDGYEQYERKKRFPPPGSDEEEHLGGWEELQDPDAARAPEEEDSDESEVLDDY